MNMGPDGQPNQYLLEVMEKLSSSLEKDVSSSSLEKDPSNRQIAQDTWNYFRQNQGIVAQRILEVNNNLLMEPSVRSDAVLRKNSGSDKTKDETKDKDEQDSITSSLATIVGASLKKLPVMSLADVVNEEKGTSPEHGTSKGCSEEEEKRPPLHRLGTISSAGSVFTSHSKIQERITNSVVKVVLKEIRVSSQGGGLPPSSQPLYPQKKGTSTWKKIKAFFGRFLWRNRKKIPPPRNTNSKIFESKTEKANSGSTTRKITQASEECKQSKTLSSKERVTNEEASPEPSPRYGTTSMPSMPGPQSTATDALIDALEKRKQKEEGNG